MGENLDRILRDATQRLFDDFEHKAAVVPFTRGHVRGTLTITTHQALSKNEFAIPSLHSAADLADWAVKLSRQLLAKVAPTPRDVESLELGTPRIVPLAEVQPSAAARATSDRFLAAAGGVSVRLEVVPAVSISFRPGPQMTMPTLDIFNF